MSDKTIQFVDSAYRELFRIFDGGKVTITAADGYTREATCKYIDDYHFYLDNSCLHICQFAEMMERNGSKCEPCFENTYEFVPVATDEQGFAMPNRDKEKRGCVGVQKGTFNRDNRLFLDGFITETEALKTSDFNAEFAEVMNFLRLNGNPPLLKDRNSMLSECAKSDVLKIPNEYYDISMFKVIGKNHTHYLNCFSPKDSRSDSDCFFTVTAYNTNELQRYCDLRYVEQNKDCLDADKFYKTANGFTELYYNPDAASGGQIVQLDFDEHIVKLAAESSNYKDFFDCISSMSKGYLIDVGTDEFRATFDDYKDIESDFEGINKRTMRELMRASGVKMPDKAMER